MALLHPMHLALLALVVLLVFGPRKLPELARGVGEAMKELKQTLHGGDMSREREPSRAPEAEAYAVAATAAPLPEGPG
jgi:sec-independent protein translocase protein TatA